MRPTTFLKLALAAALFALGAQMAQSAGDDPVKLQGLRGGERVVSYSHKTLSANSRYKVVDQIAGKAS